MKTNFESIELQYEKQGDYVLPKSRIENANKYTSFFREIRRQKGYKAQKKEHAQ